MFEKAKSAVTTEECGRDSAKALDLATLKQLEDDIRELAGHINAAMGRLLELVQRFDEAGGWADFGYLSCASWLSASSGVSPRAATEQVRVARALSERNAIKEALTSGELSYSKAAAITRIATDNNESDLLAIAKAASAADTEGMVRDYRRAVRASELRVAEERHTRRYCRSGYDQDGWYLRARLCPEDGALVTKALEVTEQALQQDDHGDHHGDERAPYEARTADALVAIAESTLAHAPKARGGHDRYHILVHADLKTLAGDGGCGELHDGPALNPETLRRLACDSCLTTVLEQNGQPLDVGRRTRSIPTGIARALQARDRHCRFPGCRRTRFTERHHIRFVVRDRGETSLDNLIVLCWAHHRLLHEGGFTLAREDGQLVFRRPDGAIVQEPEPNKPRGPGIIERNDAAGLAIDAETMPRWTGDLMDRDIAVHVLLQRDDLLELPPRRRAGPDTDRSGDRPPGPDPP